ncbi:4-hydroxy-3-methylbut-2-enyl diphosphate reductase [Acidaminobacter sp. JC074]|uniref:4-hydroxy-3-methylbut-2-enyl diphosphate reductase n=1 Tax=Acidaminobacter sp. JC074 TaxID=2530199 RepID=UPI001F0DF1E9|nr:4-hydroxy-3-methylbut-2-enyl diphosphate reductase [Acidaminobacter sp. JC074]MCH4888850.1 4-hydroxy-3-methylbut-2-enyl diphosphate reductase [Acidaminobacter sp. JC074]
MKIIIADKAGFCFGVKRAVDMAINYTESHDSLISLGQLIHNDQVTNRLEKNGLVKVDNLEGLKDKTVLIRSHGVGKDIYEKSEAQNLEMLDATCPFVKKVHRIVHDYHDKGYKIIIVGNKDHPEIIGINGWCKNEALIVSDENELPVLDKGPYCLVAQTTLKLSVWNGLVDKVKSFDVEAEFFNTICSATAERQRAAMALAPKVDLMIVIGGYHSSNTRKLYEICSTLCEETLHVEKKSDLVMTNLDKYVMIGITAGASTPDWVIEEIVDHLKAMQ